MTKNTALVMTLDLLKSKKTVTPAEINKHVGKGNYASKYICYLKNRGHNIETTKQGREIVGYKYLGQDASAERVKRASQRGTVSTVKVVKAETKKTKTAASKKEKKASKPIKSSKPAKPETDGKPVMTKEEIKKATAAIMALREKGAKKAVEKTLTAPVVASSFTVDPDWDSADSLSVRELGL